MKRLHLFEIEDQAWCPAAIRSGLTDYLRFALEVTRHYEPAVSVLGKALQQTHARRVLDLCSGGGGPWPHLRPLLAETGIELEVTLSDKYPNLEAFERVKQLSNGAIRYRREPVDATRVTSEPGRFRTLFTSFHHFRPEEARAILADAAAGREGIGIFEATERTPLMMLLTLLAPFHALIFTPFIRPFRWSRLFWTYLIPVLPLTLLFDGLVSCLRAYTLEELREMTRQLEVQHYEWEIGRLAARVSLTHVIYLIGVPKENPSSKAQTS
jgi:hypothetical protein